MTSDGDKLRWCGALVAFDYCDTGPLAALVRGEAIPLELRSVIASIIAGDRKPNRRAAAKSKVDAAERLQIGATVDALLVTIAELKHPEITEPWADLRQAEPADAILRLNEWIERVYLVASDRLAVSRETVENLVREYRQKMQDWPRV